MAVYVAAHKDFKQDLPQSYLPIFVGAKGKDSPFLLTDSTGDNISEKNPSFCELTALYWVWKNTNDSYKGLAHYRRYFKKNGEILSHRQITEALLSFDIITAKGAYLRETAHEEFCKHSGFEKDLELLKGTVGELYPDYLPAFDTVFSLNRLRLFNMLIASAEVFDAYCEWLFDILFALEGKVDMNGYTPYQQRLYGFLAERLLNVWILHNGLRVCECAVLNTEMPPLEALKLKLRNIKNHILFIFKK